MADAVAGQPGSVTGIWAKKTRGVRVARWCAWAVLSSESVGACGHAGRRFFAGFSPVDSAHRPLHDGMVTNTF